ncbi:MAG: DMT family transporter [Candidatus Actinomarina sp.]|nr:DMT family transporter [Candidatus Actinomarina sp.]MBL6763010.1 DMT family transporter [Candidatus Actinomarina sp.]
MNIKLRAYFLISLLAVSWGTIPLIIRTSNISSLSLVGIRTFLGSLFLLLFVLKQRGITKQLFNSGFVLGPLLAIHWSTMFKSIELNSVAVGIGLVFSYPIFVILIEIFRGQKVARYQILIILTGFFGLFFLLDISSIASPIGVVYGIISAITLAFLIIYGSKKSKEYGGLNVAFVQVVFAAVCLSPFTVSGFDWMLDNLEVSIFLGFFLTGIGLATYWYVVKIITPLSIGTITYLEPVTGVVIGTLILDESLNGFQYFGFGLVVLAGIAQVYLDSK